MIRRARKATRAFRQWFRMPLERPPNERHKGKGQTGNDDTRQHGVAATRPYAGNGVLMIGTHQMSTGNDSPARGIFDATGQRAEGATSLISAFHLLSLFRFNLRT